MLQFHRFSGLLPLLLAILVAGGCGGDSPAEPEPTTDVSVRDSFFQPTSIVVSPGATVNWDWAGSLQHNVTWDEADLPNSPTQVQGEHEVTMPAVPGEYGYHCTIHVAQGMRGTVRVQAN
jgi:plastocyanin